MSSTIVPTTRINDVQAHPNADTLELAIVSGFQCAVPKGRYHAGDLVTYIPPDSVLSLELSDRLGITKYLRNGRVKSIRLRGEPSHGVVIDPEGNEGDNVAEKLGITKYDPDVNNPRLQGGGRPDHPNFCRYTDMENLRHFPNILEEGEEVIVTEKIHGTNSRIGIIWDDDTRSYRWVAGSKHVQRDVPRPGEDPLYWLPYNIPGIRTFVEVVLGNLLSRRIPTKRVVVFGELYGSNIQPLNYGSPQAVKFRVFDVLMDDTWADFIDVVDDTPAFEFDTVPILYQGPYSFEKIKELANGPSTIGGDHIREGVVVRPVKERTSAKIGRVILKYVSDAHLIGDFKK